MKFNEKKFYKAHYNNSRPLIYLWLFTKDQHFVYQNYVFVLECVMSLVIADSIIASVHYIVL